MAAINRAFFFEQAKIRLFNGSFSQKQVDGLAVIVDRWETKHAAEDDRWLAYMLATAHHETDRKMQPIKEYGGPAYFKKMYDVTGNRPSLAKSMGNTQPGDGARYFGRGFVQLTWKSNYKRAGDKIGVDLVAHPDRALELGAATEIMFAGMIEGWFTGKKLSQYFNATTENWVNARRIINGLDKANLIADYAKRYYGAISYKK
jgi:putative chitinase